MRDRIISLLKQGKTYRQIVEEVGCSKSTINYHAKRLGIAKEGSSYDWTVIQAFHDKGNSRRACQRVFGFSSDAWANAVKRGALVPREWRIPVESLLVAGRGTRRTHLKFRLLNAGLLRTVCYACGISDWRGQKLSLQLNHINGEGDDNRLENLELLCPNCHSLTPTFAGKNIKRRMQKNVE